MKYNGEIILDIGDFIDNLEVGTEIKRQLKTTDGVILIEKGTRITEIKKAQLKRFKNRIEHIQLDDIDPKDADDLLNMGRKPKETVQDTLMEEVEDDLNELSGNFNDATAQKIQKNMDTIVKSITESTEFQHNIERRYIEQLNDESSHSVTVACFSILLSKRYNDRLKALNPRISEGSLINLKDVAMAAVFKDIGRDCKNSEKLKEVPAVSEVQGIEKTLEQFPAIKDVPLDKYDKNWDSVYSYLLLNTLSEETISKDSRTIALLSNEPEKGNGCLKAEQVMTEKRPNVTAAKIIHICDIFDKSMKSAIEQEHSLEEVVAEVTQLAEAGIINKELVELFMKNIQLYPINTRVVLSNGRIARVIRNYYDKYDVYKPTVQIVATGEIIDLRKCTDITIKSLITKLMFPRLIKDQVEAMKNRAMTTRPDIDEER